MEKFSCYALIMMMMVQTVTASHANGATSPVWAVDPSVPGPDLPPAGASLFDQVTLTPDGGREVPFPFAKLIQRLEAAAGCSASSPCVRSVLLPLGRSLQRVAASPDYFRYPRVVSGVVADGRGPWLLRNRLYLGYQEQAGLIEVISYNEASGRFEFQQVKNYRPDGRPAVFQARRAVCLACHQNHAPIFSRQVWDETNANPAIAVRLERQWRSYHSVPARGSTDIANAMDDATDRSNRMVVWQKLWSEGCGGAEAGMRCRSAALVAAAQFGLTERRAYDTGSESFRRDVVATLQRNALRLWPAGLAIPNSDIPNRDPLATGIGSSALAASHVPSQLEPLVPRPPLEILQPDGRRLADELVKGIAESYSANDVSELKDALEARANQRAVRRAHAVPCKIQRRVTGARYACAEQLRGIIEGSNTTVELLGIGGAGVIRNLDGGSVSRPDSGTVKFAPQLRGRDARLPDGNRVVEISIEWAPAPNTGETDGTATISVLEDFAAVRGVVDKVIDKGAPRQSLQRAISVLKDASDNRCCDDPVSALPLLEPVSSPRDAAALTAPFESHCGVCHHTADVSPPNFLSGDAARVARSLRSCAPRIHVRLAMNDLPAHERDKTPMPPERAFLPGQKAEELRVRKDLRALRARVETLLRSEYGRVPAVSELLQQGYEELRPCMSRDGS